MQKPAIFLDRDGILNSLVFDPIRGVMAAPLDPSQLVLEQGATRFVRELNERGYLVLVVTDQPGVAQGRLTTMLLDRMHTRLRALFAAAGARLDGIFVCPHDVDAHTVRGTEIRREFATACRCRRPAPGLILQAAAVHDVDLARSFLIGRELRAIKAGRTATVETILQTRARLTEIEAPPDLRPHHVAPDLHAALAIIDGQREATLRP